VTANDVLARAFDATRLHPLAGINDQGQLDYLLLDDDKLNSLPGPRRPSLRVAGLTISVMALEQHI